MNRFASKMRWSACVWATGPCCAKDRCARILAATLPPLIASGVNLQRLILVTDSMTPDDVEERGHMDNVVRRAIELGLSPLQAIQSVTLNPAIYSGLEQEIGGIAPGRFADLRSDRRSGAVSRARGVDRRQTSWRGEWRFGSRGQRRLRCRRN